MVFPPTDMQVLAAAVSDSTITVAPFINLFQTLLKVLRVSAEEPSADLVRTAVVCPVMLLLDRRLTVLLTLNSSLIVNILLTNGNRRQSGSFKKWCCQACLHLCATPPTSKRYPICPHSPGSNERALGLSY